MKSAVEQCADACGLQDVRPFGGGCSCVNDAFFTGAYNGRPCFVKYSRRAAASVLNEYRCCSLFYATARSYAPEALFGIRSGSGAYAGVERLTGGTLEEILNRGGMTGGLADSLADGFIALAEALADARLFHRDIRPANLIIGAEGRVKLIDFQFARCAGDKEDPFLARHLQLLMRLGDFLAPAPGLWNDAWSLECCLALFPQTERVMRARRVLATRAHEEGAFFRVRLPLSTRLRVKGGAWWRAARSYFDPSYGQKPKTVLYRRFAAVVGGRSDI